MNGLKSTKVKPRLKKHPVKVDDNIRTICSDMAIGYTKEPIAIGTPTDITGMKVTKLTVGDRGKTNESAFSLHPENSENAKSVVNKTRNRGFQQKHDYTKAKQLAQDPSYINQSGRGKGKVNWKRIADECGIPYGAVFAHFNTNPERFKGSAERI